MKKRVLSLIWTVAIMMAFVPTCFASGWANIGISVAPVAPQGGIASSVTTVLGVVQWIGFIVAIAMLIYVGIKYLTAGAGEKAKVKDTLIPMLIGAVLVALAPTIAKAVFSTLGGSSAS